MAEKSILPQWLQKGFLNLLTPLVELFTKWNFSPNTFTVWGLLVTSMATVIIILDMQLIPLAGALILVGGICDVMDGKLARNSGRETKFGALFDSSIDRYSEVIMYFGIAYYYVRQADFVLSIITFIALGGSMMVSYVRARAEGLNFTVKIGLMQRPERVVFIGAGALFHFTLFKMTLFHVVDYPVTPLEIVIWAVAILANITAIQRLFYVYKKDKAFSKQEVKNV